MIPIARSQTKSVDIAAPVAKTFRFIADPMNWPQYALVNLKSVQPSLDGTYLMETRRGNGRLTMHAEESFGILYNTWEDSQARWTVPVRVVANGQGSTLMMTFFQPPQMSDADFKMAMGELDIEFAKLKEVLERGSPGHL